jgi:hypothetical protein
MFDNSSWIFSRYHHICLGQRLPQAREELLIIFRKLSDPGDPRLVEQQTWMSGFEFRNCGFNGLGSRATNLAYLKSRHAIKGQSIKSPTGDVPVAETEQPRLGRAIRARPSTLQAPAPPPNATESRPGYRQRVTKCINKYRLCTKNASSSTLERAVWRAIRHSKGRDFDVAHQRHSRDAFGVDTITVPGTIENPIEPVPPYRCTCFTEAIRKTLAGSKKGASVAIRPITMKDVRRIPIMFPTTIKPG